MCCQDSSQSCYLMELFSGFGELPQYFAIVFSFSDAQFVYR